MLTGSVGNETWKKKKTNPFPPGKICQPTPFWLQLWAILFMGLGLPLPSRPPIPFPQLEKALGACEAQVRQAPEERVLRAQLCTGASSRWQVTLGREWEGGMTPDTSVPAGLLGDTMVATMHG